jgi:kynurenine formamidase
MSKFVDLSHPIEAGMITYKGLPAPIISDHLTRQESQKHYAPGTEFYIGKIEMVANTGTYLDAPFHRYAEREDVSQLSFTSIADLDGVLIRTNGRSIDRHFFEGRDLHHKAVLVHTGWDVHWRTEKYFENHPYLTRDAVEHLIESKVALVGIDSLNIDDTADLARPAHSLLLHAGIPIVEHLCNLNALPDSRFRFFAVPAPVQGLGSFPVRAFAIL